MHAVIGGYGCLSTKSCQVEQSTKSSWRVSRRDEGHWALRLRANVWLSEMNKAAVVLAVEGQRNKEIFQVGWRMLSQLRDGHSAKRLCRVTPPWFGSCGLLASAGEVSCTASQDHDEALVKSSIVVVCNLAPMLEPHWEGVNDRKGWVGELPGIFDWGVYQFVHFDQRIGDGGTIVMLKELLVC